MLVFGFSVMSCESSDDYNPDTAESYYTPDTNGNSVSSITTTSVVNGREYSWTYDFDYDINNRIKEINVKMKHYDKNRICNITSNAKYYYDKVSLKIKYVMEFDYPDDSDKNYTLKGTYSGAFNKNGTLANFYSYDCEYSGTLFTKAYVDGGDEYAFEYDTYNNLVRTYRCDESGGVETSTLREYSYTPFNNRTNFDFASFLGYNIVERLVYVNELPVYAIFQLGAFGMFGSVSTHLPEGDKSLPYGGWEFNADKCPVSFVSAEGRKSVITYK